ncbi:hypothetical protein [Burkholderia oklahomensis]|nr:hypothetical protein [Burkholderia oklahomensis]AJX31447.1 arsR family regulatory protein [Burkholderia oklahomensis C6786]AOI41318.1 ArsR family transcriptional regulator [Burkholderia oklahomensis EO147]AOI44925.1 ArsR family transcriptional regulator [Burkholderia oklahomensis C6786]KUY63807.1 ArsR family transcriptional regulator [Burkholderia oklahomensis EO147]KUY65390.1 ArsR family transcriptional regulator [Burkholderia oklahomensis C6786]
MRRDCGNSHGRNFAPIREIAERWIGKFERRLHALADPKRGLEAARTDGDDDG